MKILATCIIVFGAASILIPIAMMIKETCSLARIIDEFGIPRPPK